MSIYIWMSAMTFIMLITYNEHVKKESEKATWVEIAWMTILAPVFISVSLGILAAESINK